MVTRVLRWLLGGFIIFLALSIGSLIYLSYSLNKVIKQAIEQNGVDDLGSPVTVDAIDFSLLSGKGTLYNVAVQNMPGFSSLPIFTIGEMNFVIDVKNIKENRLIIDRLNFNNTQIVVEANKQGENNLIIFRNKILTESQQRDSSANSRRIVIKTFDSTNRHVLLLREGEKWHKLDLPDVESIHSIGAEEGISLSEVLKQIFLPILDSALKDVASQRKLNEQSY